MDYNLIDDLRHMIPKGRPLSTAERFKASVFAVRAADEIEKLRSTSEELALLRRVAEKSCDYLFGETNPEFAAQCGGMSALRSELVDAMNKYREATDVDCRSIP